ncbi:MAG: quinone-dependent dihydroorotate dehydrogenase [Proteobacteria bacterium]|nr:quinone-dependent dihydroorotate dehydrogenase [Pseudomonadota bacterium]
MYKLLRTFLFLLPPELVHRLSHIYLKLFSRIYRFNSHKSQLIKGLRVGNKIGLAAGFDKNGQLISELEDIGFGLIEVGTVTPKAQPGNPKPRLHRLNKNESLINSLGFNNHGMEAMLSNLKGLKKRGALGINIGPNKNTKFENILEEYFILYKAFSSHADYIAINISSPNTPGLRNMHDPLHFEDLIRQISAERSTSTDKPKILIKFSPDEKDDAYIKLIEILNNSDLDGVIVSNTTVDNNLKIKSGAAGINGGISGKLLQDKSNKLLTFFKKNLKPEKIIVAVGGVFDVDSYNKKLDLGADFVQIYTGFVYEGPSLIKRIVQNGK